MAEPQRDLTKSTEALGCLLSLIGRATSRTFNFVAQPGTALSEAGRYCQDLAAQAQFEEMRDAFAKAQAAGLSADRFQTRLFQTVFIEWLRDLESEVPDEHRHKLLHRVVLAAAWGIEGDEDSSKQLLFIRTARELTGLQAHLFGILAEYRAPDSEVAQTLIESLDKGADQYHPSLVGLRKEYRRAVMDRIGLPYADQVARLFGNLQEKLLIQADWRNSEQGCLTDYGRDFADYIKRGDQAAQ